MFTLYGLLDPDTKELRYIGYSSNYRERYKEHLLPSSLKCKTHKVSWIKSLLKENKRKLFVLQKEFSFKAKYLKRGHKYCSLVCANRNRYASVELG